MLSKLREEQEREEGFTLIELLVVVIIIGILAAIAIPAFLNQRQRAYQAGLTSDVRNASLEIESIATSNNGAYPTAISQTFAVSTANTAGVSTTLVYYPYGTAGFCLQGSRTDLTGNVRYQSYSGGLGNFNATATDCPNSATIGSTSHTRGTAVTLTDTDGS